MQVGSSLFAIFPSSQGILQQGLSMQMTLISVCPCHLNQTRPRRCGLAAALSWINSSLYPSQQDGASVGWWLACLRTGLESCSVHSCACIYAHTKEQIHSSGAFLDQAPCSDNLQARLLKCTLLGAALEDSLEATQLVQNAEARVTGAQNL